MHWGQVLNFFNQGTGFNGGSGTDRGANNATEFARQRAKIIAAITAISPDVAGLTEVGPDPLPERRRGQYLLMFLIDMGTFRQLFLPLSHPVQCAKLYID